MQVRATPPRATAPATTLAVHRVPHSVATREPSVTSPRHPRHPRRLVLVALGLTVALAGCSATNAITTDRNYDPSDGLGIVLGEVELTNVLVLTAAEGEAGTVLGAATNRGTNPVDLSIGLGDGADTVVALPAGGTVTLGPDAETVGLESVPAPPGALVTLYLETAAGGSVTLDVPVLDGTLPEYEDLVPAS